MRIPLRERKVSPSLHGADRAGAAAGRSEGSKGEAVAVTLIEGNATEYVGEADLILTNPYAKLPGCFIGLPMLIANFANRKERCELYAGAELHEIAVWSRGLKCRVWVANAPVIPVDLSDLVEEEEVPGRGWFPLELPLRLLRAYAQPSSIVCDPFMGRGTVGKACQMLGHRFVGIDRDPSRVQLAREYLGC